MTHVSYRNSTQPRVPPTWPRVCPPAVPRALGDRGQRLRVGYLTLASVDERARSPALHDRALLSS
ncbi:protein of unknown function [Methylocaldum szegediense]|uniref:Uncharacterized protein n=1 Tax=Methylocaldum szegediense TaxID=73780 RepID=A0ABM9I339_9GAMM|nr:protein of unknown function [Methylocaldum szegediense]